MTKIRRRIDATGERTLTMAKRVIDQFDLEAEREGNAIKGHTVIRRGWGKGITKQRNMHKRGNEILTTRIVKREGWIQ
tara:strand:- start:116 stop:349 length:234 start_codon:yes stop_codon:yes gene_type:complete